MKALLALVPVLMVSIAQADRYPQPARTLILQAVTDGGFRAPSKNPCSAFETSLYSDGAVVLSRCGVISETVLLLPKPKVAMIQAKIQNLGEVGPLVKADPNSPVCNDAPFTDFNVIKDGKVILVGGQDQCVELIASTDESGESYGLRSILSSLNILATQLRK